MPYKDPGIRRLKGNEYAKAWRDRNPEKVKAIRKVRQEKYKTGEKEKWRDPTKEDTYRKASRERYPEKHKASQAVRNAVYRGTLIKPESCEKCGATGVLHGHHHNGYENKLDVIWLCHACHVAEHMETA